jgi:hypothetical protein
LNGARTAPPRDSILLYRLGKGLGSAQDRSITDRTSGRKTLEYSYTLTFLQVECTRSARSTPLRQPKAISSSRVSSLGVLRALATLRRPVDGATHLLAAERRDCRRVYRPSPGSWPRFLRWRWFLRDESFSVGSTITGCPRGCLNYAHLYARYLVLQAVDRADEVWLAMRACRCDRGCECDPQDALPFPRSRPPLRFRVRQGGGPGTQDAN